MTPKQASVLRIVATPDMIATETSAKQIIVAKPNANRPSWIIGPRGSLSDGHGRSWRIVNGKPIERT